MQGGLGGGDSEMEGARAASRASRTAAGDDTRHADDQEETEDAERDSQAMCIVASRAGDGGYWNRDDLTSGAPVTSKRTSQEPEAIIQMRAGIEGGIGRWRASSASGVGGCFEASPVIGKRGDADRVDWPRRSSAKLDGGDARDDDGRADGDKEFVGTGVDLLEDIFAAYVSVSRKGAAKDRAREKRRMRADWGERFTVERSASSVRS